jgi:hypothetical protein
MSPETTCGGRTGFLLAAKPPTPEGEQEIRWCANGACDQPTHAKLQRITDGDESGAFVFVEIQPPRRADDLVGFYDVYPTDAVFSPIVRALVDAGLLDRTLLEREIWPTPAEVLQVLTFGN